MTITGTGFTGATGVKFGSTTAAFTITNSTTISATAPAGAGTVDITVTGPGGTSGTTAADQIHLRRSAARSDSHGHQPDLGHHGGGTTVTITGTGFTGATGVKFGSTTAAFTITNSTTISATAPAGTGTVDITVTGPAGTERHERR